MELDSLKKSWQDVEVKPPIDEAKIQHMINNKGQSAYSGLLKYEQITIISLIIVIPLSFVLRDTLVVCTYIGSVMIGLIWQFYKYSFIKGIDFSTMSLIEISLKISRYRKYLIREIIVNSVWAVLFIALWIFRVLYKDLLKTSLDSSSVSIILIVAYVAIVLFSTIITLVIYKRYVSKNIKKIEQSIEEVKEFENEN